MHLFEKPREFSPGDYVITADSRIICRVVRRDEGNTYVIEAPDGECYRKGWRALLSTKEVLN